MKKILLLLLLVPVLAGGCKFLVSQLIDYVERWPSGLEKVRGKMIGDQQTGEWMLTYETGEPLAKGFYKDDRQFGQWTFYYPNGKEMRSGRYDENGLRTGLWLYKYEDQTPKARGSYVGDFEDGPWTFYGPDGVTTMEGSYDVGKQSGFWQFYYPGGRPKAAGMYHGGDRVGPWQVWSETGASRIQDFASKAGVQLVREVYDDGGSVRRVGVVANGKASGRWNSYHRNGRVRLCCGMSDGALHGTFVASDENGTVFAQGRFDDGAIAADSICVVDGIERPLPIGPLPGVPNANAWSPFTELQKLLPAARLSLLVAEARSTLREPRYVAVEIDPAGQPTEEAALPVAEQVVAAIDEQPARMPAPAQPRLTVKQKQQMEKMVDEYSDGPQQGGSMFGDYAPAAGSPRPKMGTGRREGLEGKELPFQELKAIDGDDVDLRAYRGKQRVMIVVLRGFLGEVCCYCIAQTKALAKARAKLEQADVEVLVIYPGEKENQRAFRQLYEQEFGEGPPPYRVFYDPDLELVTQLGIEGELASPTTLLIDKQGIVQYAYVGEHIADRPATKKLIELIEKM